MDVDVGVGKGHWGDQTGKSTGGEEAPKAGLAQHDTAQQSPPSTAQHSTPKPGTVQTQHNPASDIKQHQRQGMQSPRVRQAARTVRYGDSSGEGGT